MQLARAMILGGLMTEEEAAPALGAYADTLTEVRTAVASSWGVCSTSACKLLWCVFSFSSGAWPEASGRVAASFISLPEIHRQAGLAPEVCTPPLLADVAIAREFQASRATPPPSPRSWACEGG